MSGELKMDQGHDDATLESYFDSVGKTEDALLADFDGKLYCHESGIVFQHFTRNTETKSMNGLTCCEKQPTSAKKRAALRI